MSAIRISGADAEPSCRSKHHCTQAWNATRSACSSATRRRHGEDIEVRAEARSFLHHQVRNFVGSLKLVGEGRWSAEDLRRVLEVRDRAAAGPTAPAAGLYLTEVGYGAG